MLPDFTDDGLLPPGLHRASWEEVTARFGVSARRQWLLEGLQAAAVNLRDAGLRQLWLDGSFTTKKTEPKDYDGVWFTDGVDLLKVDPVLRDLADLRNGRVRQKAKYRGELLIGATSVGKPPMQLFFQQTRDGADKGIVLLDVRTLP